MTRFGLLTAVLAFAAGVASGSATPATGQPDTRALPNAVQPIFVASGRVDTRSLSGALEPIVAPLLPQLGPIQVRNLAAGTTETLEIRRFGNGVRVTEPSGCTWTKGIDWFAPSDSFANCSTSKNWRTATAEVRQLQSIFPMQVGARGAYHRRAVSSTGKFSERRTDCQVMDAVDVVLPSAQVVPAYVVACYDGRVRRTTWFAPDIGPVAYREVHDKRGLRDAWVRVSVPGRA